MGNQLQNLKVGRVSFVDRAAVRDPASKSDPRRFLLFKADGASNDNNQEDGMATATTSLSDALRRAMADHGDELAAGDIGPRLSQIAALADERRSESTDPDRDESAEALLRKSMGLLRVAKAEVENPSLADRAAIQKAERKMQLDYLRMHSPQAALVAEGRAA